MLQDGTPLTVALITKQELTEPEVADWRCVHSWMCGAGVSMLWRVSGQSSPSSVYGNALKEAG